MTRILLIAAVVCMLAAAALGFLTKGKLAGMRLERDDVTRRLTFSEEKNRKLEATVKQGVDEMAAVAAGMQEKDAQLATARTEATTAADKIATMTKDLTDKNAEIERLNGVIAASTPGAPPNPGDPTIAPVNDQALRDAQAKLAELQTLNDTLSGKITEAEGRSRDLEMKERARQAGISRPGIEARIQAVNQAWNFVVIDKGDRQGVAANSQLVVKRGEEMIARLRVTSVEPGTSIADVIPGSMARGAFVRPGDTAIFSSAR